MGRRCWIDCRLLVPVLLTVAFSQPCFAWDFTLGGASNTWAYASYGQLGKRGFFGLFDIDASPNGDFAPLNGWVGNRGPDVGSLVSGTNGAYTAVSVETNPRIVGDWVQASGKYLINVYDSGTTQGAYVPMSPGQLAMWSVSVSTPVVTLIYGKRSFANGYGLQFAATRTKEYLIMEDSLSVPDVLTRLVFSGWLPRRVISWFNPEFWPRFKRQKGVPEPEDLYFKDETTGKSKFKDADEKGEGGFFQADPKKVPPKKNWPTDEDAYAWGQIGPARLRLGLGFYPWEQIIIPVSPAVPLGAWNTKDLNFVKGQNVLVYLDYASTDMVIGVGGLYVAFHQGPELQQTEVRRFNTPTKETYLTEGWVFLNYSNGRFFFKTELDWFKRTIRFQRSLTGFFQDPDAIAPPVLPGSFTDGSGRSRFAPQYRESWRYMAEAGVHCGPLGLSLLYAFMPGPDRRHGILIDRQPFIQENEQAALGVFDQYSILMAYLYGSGVNAPAHISDASVFGIRLEYALAANLMLQASALKALRNSQGYGWGYIRPNPAAGAFGTVDYDVRGSFAAPSPAIPDNDLGWEFMVGVNWKLLSGWAVETRVAYWQPGRWFNFACIDRSVPNWTVPDASNNWGASPERKIDPVLGFELRLGATY